MTEPPLSKPNLSVVLPNFNHAQFLGAALDALLHQTRPADEIIVIDDASTDASAALIERYQASHPAVRLVRNEKNLGVVRNLNRGLDLARGKLVYFAAADDVAAPALFATAIALLGAHPQAALFSARCNIIGPDGSGLGTLATPLPLASSGFLRPSDVGRFLLKEDSWFNGSSTVWRRMPLVEAGGFPASLGAFTDGYMSRKLALRHGCCFSPDVLSSWRRMEGGYAWKSTELEKSRKLVDAVRREMAKDGDLFPPGYADLWARRYIFGVRRFSLAQATSAAAAVGWASWIKARAAESVLSLWYFARLRPGDLVSVARRRVLSFFG